MNAFQPAGPLAFLRDSTIVHYRNGQHVYDEEKPASNLYLIIYGTVNVFTNDAEGKIVGLDIYGADDFFGESAFLGLPRRDQHATALENCGLKSWTTRELDEMISEKPCLGIALLPILIQRVLDFTERIESFARKNVQEHLAIFLLRLSKRFGVRQEDGAVEMMALTHGLLASYVGTEREVVTDYMNRFRRAGYLRYSRKGIILYPEALSEWVRQKQ